MLNLSSLILRGLILLDTYQDEKVNKERGQICNDIAMRDGPTHPLGLKGTWICGRMVWPLNMSMF